MENDSQIDPQNASTELEAVDLGDFDILEQIGEGGMGRVYRARHKGLDKIVALKILASDRTDSAMVRFHNEAKTLSKLRNEFIADVYDFGVSSKGEPYMAIEFIDGQTLQQVLEERGKMPVDEVAQLSIEICQALEHAHQKGVIHRDVKPGNVMMEVSDDGTLRPKVVDFGIAKSEDCLSEITRTGSMVGSPLYMSPEQSVGGKVTAQSDMYSLACVMFHCLVGRPPFSGDTIIDTIKMKRELPAPLVKDQFPENEQTPELLEMSKITDRMLAKNPDQRFQSMKDVESQLEQLLDSMTVVEEAPPAVATTAEQTVPLTARTSSRNVILIALALLLPVSFFILKQLDSTYKLPSGVASNSAQNQLPSSDVTTTLKEVPHSLTELTTIPSGQGSLPKEDQDLAEASFSHGGGFGIKEDRPVTVADIVRKINAHNTDFYYEKSALIDADMTSFDSCTTARYVNLRGVSVSDAGLAHLKNSKILRLEVSGTLVRTLQFLPAKKTLIVLQLNYTHADDQSLENLKDCTSLEQLDLNHTKVTAKGLLKLKHLPLRFVNCSQLEGHDIAMLEQAFPNCYFNQQNSFLAQKYDDAAKKLKQGKGQSAIDDFEKLRKKARRNKDANAEVSYLVAIGNVLTGMGQFHQATSIWKNAIKVAEDNHCTVRLLEAYTGYLDSSPELYRDTGANQNELKDVIKKYIVALDRYQPNLHARCVCLNALGKHLVETNRLDLAKEIFEKSIAEQKEIWTTIRKIFKPDLDDKKLEPTIKLWQKDDKANLAATQVQLADVLGRQGNIEEAHQLFRQGLSSLEQVKDSAPVRVYCTSYETAARFERQICKDYERALQLIDQALALTSDGITPTPPEVTSEKRQFCKP